MKIVKKKWGQEDWIVNGEYCMKILYVNPGNKCSLHYHPEKDETFYFLNSGIRLEVGGSCFWPQKFDHVRIPQGTEHRFHNGSEKTCLIMECSTHHSDDDVVRLEESE